MTMTAQIPRTRKPRVPAVAPAPKSVPAEAPTAMTKSGMLRRLLERNKGATLAELVAESGWQPHSTRAWLTGVRKKNREALLRETRRNGESCYRLAATAQ
jgi:hypothetical protein